MLEDIKVGDRVINDLGEEATIVRIDEFKSGNVRLDFNPSITGWIGSCPNRSWCYTKEGKFLRDEYDFQASNLVKVLRHD